MARKTGKFGALYLGSDVAGLSKVADLYDWTWEPSTEMLDCSIKSDAFDRHIASHGKARFTAKRRVNTAAILAQNVFDSAASGEYLAFRLDLVDGSAALTQIAGLASASQGGLTAPRGIVDDTVEFMVDGEYSISIPLTGGP